MKQYVKFTVAIAIFLASRAHAETIRFDTDPFAGSTALTTPGRQVVGNEVFLPTFNVLTDVFSFDPSVFGVSSQISFLNSTAANLPTSGLNVIVLRDTDNDANPATPFGAGNAANLIADRIDAAGPGFFIYSNSGLGLNRLVYSTDLSVNTADLRILARILSPNGQGAIDALPGFAESNFDTSQVPEPSTMGFCAASALLGYWLLKKRQA